MNAKSKKIKELKLSKLIKTIFGVLILFVLTNNVSAISKTITINVVETKMPNFLFVHYAENELDTLSSDYTTFVSESADFISNVFPIRDSTPFIVRDENSPVTIESLNLIPGNDYKKDLLLELDRVGSLVNATTTVGIVSQSFSNKYAGGSLGFASRSGNLHAVVVVEKQSSIDYKEATPAHEIGHTYKLCDEYNISVFNSSDKRLNCPNGDKDEDGALDSECINTYGIPSLMGCPVDDQELIIDIFYSNKNVTKLVNMYGSRKSLDSDVRRWVDSRTYSYLLSNFTGEGNIICTDEELIIISGNINKSFDLSLKNFYVIKGGCYTNKTVMEDPNKDFLKIILKGSGDLIIYMFSQVIDFFIIDDGGNLTEMNEMPFVFVVPYNNATTFDFINQSNNVSLAQLNRTPNTPSLEITSDITGKSFYNQLFNVTWNSTDLDNDTLNYAVLISSDNGATYSTLEIDYTNTTLEINSTNLDESDEYVVRVLATDGINTNTSVSGTFSTLLEDTHKFYIRNSANEEIAWFGDLGNIFINGSCTAGIVCNAPPNSFIIKNSTDDTVAYIDSNGNLCLESGSCNDNYLNCDNPANGSFIIRDSTDRNVAFIDSTGALCLIGSLTRTIISNFYLANSTNKVASFSNSGSIILAGTCTSGGACTPPANSFIIKNSSSDTVAYIDSNGNLCIETGDCSDNAANCNNPGDGSFIVRNTEDNNVIYINAVGDLCLIGGLTENSIP